MNAPFKALPNRSPMLRIVAAAFTAFALVCVSGCASIPDDTPMESPRIGLAELRAKYELAGSRYIDVDGVEVHYSDEGTGDPVVMLPPSFLNFRAWDGVANALVQQGYRVIRPDFPATGLTGVDTKVPAEGKIDFFNRNAEVVAKLLEALDIQQADVIGTSSGGMAGFRLASNEPDLVRRLVLVNSAGLPRTRTSDPNRLREEERKWAALSVKPAAYWEVVLDRNFFALDAPPPWMVTLAYDVNRRQQEGDPAAYAFKTGDPKAILAKIKAPTLILWGKSNPTVVHLDADVFEHWLTGAPTVMRKYDGLGHYPYIENLDLVAGDIIAFLEGTLDGELLQTRRVKP